MNNVQTDNSYFDDKVILRIRHLPDKKEINVLDAFSGDGLIWKCIRANTDKKINVLRIDQKPNRQGTYLKGDNLKFMASMDLSEFDVIDLDAYGIPYKQLEILFRQKLKCTVFVTFIQSMKGGLPFGFLKECGYQKSMVRKIPTMFYKKAIEKLKYYLAKNGIRKINIKTIGTKHYFMVKMQ